MGRREQNTDKIWKVLLNALTIKSFFAELVEKRVFPSTVMHCGSVAY